MDLKSVGWFSPLDKFLQWKRGPGWLIYIGNYTAICRSYAILACLWESIPKSHFHQKPLAKYENFEIQAIFPTAIRSQDSGINLLWGCTGANFSALRTDGCLTTSPTCPESLWRWFLEKRINSLCFQKKLWQLETRFQDKYAFFLRHCCCFDFSRINFHMLPLCNRNSTILDKPIGMEAPKLQTSSPFLGRRHRS